MKFVFATDLSRPHAGLDLSHYLEFEISSKPPASWQHGRVSLWPRVTQLTVSDKGFTTCWRPLRGLYRGLLCFCWVTLTPTSQSGLLHDGAMLRTLTPYPSPNGRGECPH